MINPKILVTGATGRTGGAVVTQLLAKGYPVRTAVSRIQSRLVMGPRFGGMSANLARNIREERVRFVMGVCTADGARS